MSDNFTSNNLENDDSNLNNQKTDYINLICRLKKIKTTIALLEKTLLK